MIISALALALSAQVAVPQNPGTAMPAPTPTPLPVDGVNGVPAPAQPVLTDAEQKTLKRCQRMEPAQMAQSSKCSAVMVKAGKGDPASGRQTPPPQN